VAESGKESKVRVIDRRRFTAEGDERAPESTPAVPGPAVSPAPAPAPAAAAEPRPAGPPPPPVAAPAAEPAAPEGPAASTGGADIAGEPSALPPGPGISDIVDLLAQQAMAFLSGQVPGRGRDPDTARYFIDLLGVLKTKTAGRLTLEETNFLDDVLYQLRSLFVAATR
jgi:hypothetical protein